LYLDKLKNCFKTDDGIETEKLPLSKVQTGMIVLAEFF